MKNSSTLKFIMIISFLPSICIHRSIILIFIGKKSMLFDLFALENILIRDFRFSFPREYSFPQRIPGSKLFTVPKVAKIKIILSKLETKQQQQQKQLSKMLIYWSVPDRLMTPGTESLTRHTDLLDAVTHRHLQLANLAKDKLISTFSSSHLQDFHLFFTDASISNTSVFSPFASTIRKQEIYDQVVGSLSGQIFQSSCHQFASSRSTVDTITKIMASNPPTIPKRLTCK